MDVWSINYFTVVGGLMTWLESLLNMLLLVTFAPLFAGTVKKLKCVWQGRRGPSIFQPYWDLHKLFRKEVLIPENASIIFHLAPYIIFGTTCLIAVLVPFTINAGYFAEHMGDIIVLIGLFALLRFFIALAGLDLGTAFGGMGSSREMMIGALAEPALLTALLILAMVAKTTNLVGIIEYLNQQQFWIHPSLIFVGLGFILVAIAETGRIPVDNPATHLELTMVHEAMILEYSGCYLALLEWSKYLKFLIYGVLIVNLFLPPAQLVLNNVTSTTDFSKFIFNDLLVLGKLCWLTIILVTAEISLAKLRLFKVPLLLNVAFLLCLLGLLNYVIFEIF